MTSGQHRRVSPRPLTEIDFLAWLGQAMPGERFIYHRGQLALDRHARSQQGLSRLASRARGASSTWCNAATGTDDFTYLAIARERAGGVLTSC